MNNEYNKENKLLTLIKEDASYKDIIEEIYKDPSLIFLASNFIKLNEPSLREFWNVTDCCLKIKKNFLTIDFIREHKDNIDWDSLSHDVIFDFKTMKEFWDKIDWMTIIYNDDMSEEEIEFYITHIFDYRYYSDSYIIPLITHQTLSVELLDKYWHIFKNNSTYVSKWQNLTEDFIEKHAEDLNWDEISRHQVLSEDFMKKWEKKINWNWVHQTQELSKQFVMEIYNEFMLNAQHLVGYNMKFTQSFIERYYDRFKWNWVLISRYVELNSDFVLQHRCEVCWEDIARFQHFSEIWAEKYLKDYLSVYIANHKVSTDFIRKHADDIEPLYWLDVVKKQQWDEIIIREFMSYIKYDILNINVDWNFLQEFK